MAEDEVQNFGIGGYTGNVDLVARKVTTSWSLTTNYGSIKNNLVTVGSPVGVAKDIKDIWYQWDVYSAVNDWYGGSSNYGVVIEPSSTWTNCPTLPPPWLDRISVFYSSEDSGNNGPYLEVFLDPPAAKPDLVIHSKSITDLNGVSVTTVTPG